MPKEYSRTERLSQLLKQEIAQLLRREVKDARIGDVIVTEVQVTADLKHATVYVQTSGDERRKAELLEGLASAAGFIRSRLGRVLHIRRTPELRFLIDQTQEHAARISELLAEVERSEKSGANEEGE